LRHVGGLKFRVVSTEYGSVAEVVAEAKDRCRDRGRGSVRGIYRFSGSVKGGDAGKGK
jgi:hypothetical protein